MAFGRSNSLSLNTGATNSLFSQQQNSSTQPPTAGGLFGSSTAGSLFGGAAGQQQQQQQSGGGGGLFGSNNAQAPPQQPAGSLFGNAQNTQQGSGGLFGSTSQNVQPQQQQTGGLFGNSTQNTQSQQQNGSLFGNNQTQSAQQSGGLFGNTQAQPAQGQTGSLFGSSMTQARPTGGLFGSSTAPPQATTSLFGNNSGSSLFGSTTNQQQQQQQQQQQSQPSLFSQPSLLASSQYHNPPNSFFSNRLTMGQQSQQAQQQQSAQGAVKINFDTLRPTTRFGDCIDDIKTQLEAIDKMVQLQEKHCKEIEAFLPRHAQDIASLGPDVALITDKAENVDVALSGDAQGVQTSKQVLTHDVEDLERVERVVRNQSYGPGYRYTSYGADSAGASTQGLKDMDLINNFFHPLATTLQKTMDGYAANLTEIEGHMRVIEGSAVAQARHLAAKRVAGGDSGSGREESKETNSDHTVRELADTLRGFEASILGAAGVVGQCREGVNELVLGRIGAAVDRSRRPW